LTQSINEVSIGTTTLPSRIARAIALRALSRLVNLGVCGLIVSVRCRLFLGIVRLRRVRQTSIAR